MADEMSVETPAADGDVMALSGLRRLVLHARDQLAATAVQPAWKFKSDGWTPGQVRNYAAAELARHVLTLVADCLPADDGITADEARGLRQRLAEVLEHSQQEAKANADARAELKALREERDALRGERDGISEDRDLLEEILQSRLVEPDEDGEAILYDVLEERLDALINRARSSDPAEAEATGDAEAGP